MVEEGVVEVGAFQDTFAELIPRTSRGGYSARAQLALDNRGNTRVNARLTAADPDRKLNFTISPPGLVAEPGAASFARVRLSPRQRFFLGPPKTLPYKVFVHQDGQPPLAVDGAMIQQGLLPAWLIPAAIGLVALSLALVVLWLAFFQQVVKSAATSAVASPLAAAQSAAKTAQNAANQAAAGGGNKPSTAAGGGAQFRIDPTTGSNPAFVPKDASGAQAGMKITDLVFENPNANSGSLTLRQISTSGDKILFKLRLENFRDLDFHFVTPITLQNGDKLALDCAPAVSGGACDAAVLVSGNLQ
jgi:type II secretory pathway pseudopilin PulG